MLPKCNALVSTKWLHNLIKNGRMPDFRVLDASWHLPITKRIGHLEYKEKHIPGALFFNIDECSDKTSPYNHMLPNQSQFEQYAGELGIDNNTHVIVYDNSANGGFFSAPRVWWMFRVFGHETVSVLDGGFTKWCTQGLPTTAEINNFHNKVFKGSFQPHMIKSYEDIVQNIKDNSFQVMDARGKGRFTGTDPEPRAGIESGHIIGNKSLPYTSIVDKQHDCLLDTDSLQKQFTEAGIDLSKPLVATCGSGVSACCITFAAYMCGKEVPIYDGAWTEFYLRSTPDLRDCPSDKVSIK